MLVSCRSGEELKHRQEDWTGVKHRQEDWTEVVEGQKEWKENNLIAWL